MSLRDYWIAFKRRRKMGLIAALITFGIVVLAAVFWPPTYRSASTILIEQQEIPQDMVRSTITSFADQRIQVISQQVMTTANLLRIVNEYDLYPRLVRTRAREVVLEEMREDIGLNMISADVVDPRSGRPTSATIAFTLAYYGDTPDQSLKVANELTNLFLQKNVESRTQIAGQTSEFLAGEAIRLNQEIGVLEARLADFKAANVGQLPELTQLNLSLLDRTERELTDTERQLRTLDERIVFLESEVAREAGASQIFSESGERIYSPRDRLKFLESTLASLEAVYSDQHPDVVRTRKEIASLKVTIAESAASDNPLNRELAALEAERATLLAVHSSSHPDVLDIERRIDTLQTASGLDDYSNADPAYRQLKAQLIAARGERDSLLSVRTDLRNRISIYEGKLAATPMIEKDYHALNLELDNARRKYQDVKEREMEARLAQNMETDRKGERLTIIEPPLPPEQPYSPDRILLISVGAVLAIVVGILAMFIGESTDTTVRGRVRLEQLTALPALGMIPAIQTKADERRRLSYRAVGASAVVLVMISGAALVHFLYLPLDVFWFAAMRKLDL
ncbi:MAG: lipopolysaccharide biosynthesis protein [Pseudomonadota bacterium]